MIDAARELPPNPTQPIQTTPSPPTLPKTKTQTNNPATLQSLQNRETGGGFGGGFGQLSHCAPTYAAVLALLVVGTEDAYRAIDRCASLVLLFVVVGFVGVVDSFPGLWIHD